ncbi:MAG: S-methyl-5'-thioinosine phosphorylase [Deferribacteraceae bacterium]|nr:S-methyl-5'-thioinosine phosphorylase [Deferribacteraceae bacterium]
MNKLGIIAGSGMDIPGLKFIEDITVDSKYGAPSEGYKHFRYKDTDLYFLRRHGVKHEIPPHKINYRANIDGFRKLGVEAVVTVSAAGGINGSLCPGDIAVTSNAIDFTYGRNSTYFDDMEVFHIDITEPFCPSLRRGILYSAAEAGVTIFDGGVYLCTNGPRLETAAEITAYSKLGADFVGMTLFPECALARELGICFANISVITNYAAGISDRKLTSDEVVDIMGKASERVNSIVHKIMDNPFTPECDCRDSLKGTKITNG